MRRILKLKTPLLALVFSVGMEVLLLILCVFCYDKAPLFNQCWWLLHDLPDRFSRWCTNEVWSWYYGPSSGRDFTSVFLFLLFAVIQWYIIFLVVIGSYRRFHRNPT
jgi:hypothetical protein